MKTLNDWIDLLADRSKVGDIGEYFCRKDCAALLELLNELKNRRIADGKVDGSKNMEQEG